MPMPLAERARDNGSGHPGGDLFDAGGTQLTDHDAERQMLGILLTNPVATTETIEIVRPHDLHDPIHRRLYELLIHGYETDTPVTAAGLVAGLGGNVTPALNEPTSAWLARLMNRYAWIVWVGGGILGKVAGQMILEDRLVRDWPWAHGFEYDLPGRLGSVSLHPLPMGLAVILTILGWWLSRRPHRAMPENV